MRPNSNWQHVLLAAKQPIAKSWKQMFVSFAEVHRYIDFINVKITSILLGTHKKFLKTWAPWIHYVHPSM